MNQNCTVRLRHSPSHSDTNDFLTADGGRSVSLIDFKRVMHEKHPHKCAIGYQWFEFGVLFSFSGKKICNKQQ